VARAPHLRSKSRVRSAPKRHFVDPSLAVAALRATPDRLLKDLNLFGFLFESLAIRDLRVYAQAADATVLHYRDNTGLEIDAIIEAADGRWAGFEVKLGYGQVEEAAASLRKFAERVDTRSTGVYTIYVHKRRGHMEEIGVRELRRNLSAVLSAIAQGEEVVVIRHGEPVARLIPPERVAPRLPSMKALRDSVRVRGAPLSEEVVAEREAARF
jgi:prevent-host-death family protein